MKLKQTKRQKNKPNEEGKEPNNENFKTLKKTSVDEKTPMLINYQNKYCKSTDY